MSLKINLFWDLRGRGYLRKEMYNTTAGTTTVTREKGLRFGVNVERASKLKPRITHELLRALSSEAGD